MKRKKHAWICQNSFLDLPRKFIFSEELPLEARLLNTIYLAGIFGTLLTVMARIVLKDNIITILIISAIAVFILVMMYASNRLRKHTVFRWLVLAIICDISFPCIFFAMGGVNSAMPGYFVLTIVLIFFLSWGKGRVIFLAVHLALVALCYYLSSIPLFSGFVFDNSGVNKYIDHILTFTVVGLSIGFMLIFQNRIYNTEKKKADSTGRDLEQRNKLLTLVNETAEMLLSSDIDPLEKILLEAMDLMARGVDVDRMYVWRNRLIDGKQGYEQQCKWLSKTVKGSTPQSSTGSIWTNIIPQWDDYLSVGRIVNGPVSSFSEEEQRFLSPHGINSLLVIPVFLQKKFWGVVSFDDCRRERYFSQDEVSILRSGSLFLVNTIVRCNNKLLIETRMKQQELMSEISRSFISKEPVDKLVNEALRKIGEFTETNRIVVAIMENNFTEHRIIYSWASSAQVAPGESLKVCQEFIFSSFPMRIPETGFITAICCNDVATDYGGKYKILGAVGFKSFIWAPVYVDGIFWGVLSLEDCNSIRFWSDSDVQLVGTLTSAIAGAVTRDLIDKDRSAALKQAVQASEAKGNFLANMSHEIRTPMNAIIGMTSLGKNSPSMERKDYAFGKIENASTHLLGVINDILDMSKIEANKLELSLVSFDFEKMLRKVVSVINFRVEERNQEFRINIDEKIPRFLMGDDQRLAQVITNLLSNAVKFTPEKGGIHLQAKLTNENNRICQIQIEVSDTGIGLSREQQVKLFSSFEQADSGTSRKFGGTGLGLAISKRIVEMMGGRIWIDSELGKGATFGFSIPMKRGSDGNAGILASKKSSKNLRILAVDSSREILNFFSEALIRFGLNYDIADSGKKALELLAKNICYDICFIDWKIDDMNGIELARRISGYNVLAGDSPKPLIILVSGAELNDIEDEAKNAGVDKFLTKPLFPSDIIDSINEYLGVSGVKETEEPDGEETAHFEGYTILLVEDVEINREIVVALLEPTGLAIEIAENGKEAVEKFSLNPGKYDMIFMDIQMPEMDGFIATKRIRALEAEQCRDIEFHRVPIVAMTANVFREDIEKCLAVGMNDHVGKPLEIKEVIEKLGRYLPSR